MLKHALVCLALSFCFTSVTHGGLSGGIYTVDPLDLNGGGRTSTGGVYSLKASTGQAGGVGAISGGVYNAGNGFWHPAMAADSPVVSGSDPRSQAVAAGSTCPAVSNQLDLVATDGDSQAATLAWRVKTQGALGTASFVGGTTGPNVTVCYQPSTSSGNDSFVLQVYDGSGGFDDLTVNVNISVTPPPEVISWKSVRTHGSLGEIAITLDPSKTDSDTGNNGPTVETRRYGVLKLVLEFSAAVQAADGSLDTGDVEVSINDGTPPNTSVTPASIALIAGGWQLQVLFDATGLNSIGDQVRAAIDVAGKFKSFSNQVLAGDTNCQVRCLEGDGNRDGTVHATLDVGVIKFNNRVPVDSTSAHLDVNTDKNINLIDAAYAKLLAGHSAP